MDVFCNHTISNVFPYVFPLSQLLLIFIAHQDNFCYLNQGECPYVEEVDDGEGFEEMREAMDLVGIMEDQQHMIFRILAGILHIGNIDIQPSGEEESTIDVRNTKLKSIIYLSMTTMTTT